ncbi:MAG TPA: multicopper oxidase family protein [Candidatus Nanoarchaeia archaeon]|nr:multicopper oxidase family protein [Candidatus Nanoarchaeia archaeon]
MFGKKRKRIQEKENVKKSGKLFIIVGVLALVVLIGIFLREQPVKETVLSSQLVELKDGETFSIEAKPVTKIIDGRELELFTYNGQFPGPLLKVKQNSKIFIDFKNNIGQDTTIHWHGLRHNYKFDGVPDVSQPPVKSGETFRYELFFPDTGVFWYHPHIREDIQQERGMYGMIIVEQEDQEQKPREIPLIVDDMLLEKNDFYPFSEKFTNFALMGRFGNILLLNGEVQPQIKVRQGETVRFYLLNTANVRPFNLSIKNNLLQVIGSDIGAYEQPFTTASIIIAPAERYIVETAFAQPGEYDIMHINPDATYKLGKMIVESSETETQTETQALPQTDLAKYKQYFTQAPDFEYTLDIDMRGMVMNMDMHREDETIEWEDNMFMMNEMHNSLMMSWFIEDKKTGKRNMDVMADVKQDDIKMIRIKNEKNSMHPMQHPIHLHGQRFLVVRQDGQENKNLVWKDTILISKGSAVDLLVDFSNPGIWMMHCHIAEHLHSGMMMKFEVKGGEKNETEFRENR